MPAVIGPLLPAAALAAEPAPPTPEQVPAVHARMAEHYRLVTHARAAVLRGDLDEAHARGEALSRLSPDGLPESWGAALDVLSQAGRDLAVAPNVPQAADAMARIAIACADCHAATGGGPRLSATSAPPPAWTRDNDMPRHLWASEWIWLGILANDDTAVLRGAEVLAADPVRNPSATHDAWIVEREEEVHRIGREMVAAPDLAARRALYGPLMAQCGTCHMRLETEGDTP